MLLLLVKHQKLNDLLNFPKKEKNKKQTVQVPHLDFKTEEPGSNVSVLDNISNKKKKWFNGCNRELSELQRPPQSSDLDPVEKV